MTKDDRVSFGEYGDNVGDVHKAAGSAVSTAAELGSVVMYEHASGMDPCLATSRRH